MAEHRRPPSQRQLKVGEILRHALADIFLREVFYEPGLQNIRMTVSEVRVSPDLHNATVYVSSLGGKVDVKACLKSLTAMTPYLRKEVARQVVLRYMPSICFRYDTTFDHAEKIHTLLNQVAEKATEKNSEEE